MPVTVNGGLWYELDNGSPAIKIFHNGYAFNIADGTSQSISSGDSGITDPYSQFLIVDSPFSSDLSDNCGVIWTPSGNVSVSDGAAQFNNSYLRSTEQVTFGGQDFTISFSAEETGGQSGYRIFLSGQSSTNSGESGRPGQFVFYSIDHRLELGVFNSSGQNICNLSICSVSGSNDYQLVYSHVNTSLKIFVNDTLQQSTSLNFERLDRFLWLATNCYAPDSQAIVGSISNFKIYDGVAIEP